MDGITTALISFIFVCIIFPRLVKHTAQFYAAFGLIVLMMLLASVAGIFHSEGFDRFARSVSGLMQVASLLLLVLSTGGLSVGELAGEFKGAFEAIRRGPESDKTVIVPLTGERPKPRNVDPDDPDARVAHTLETPPAGAPPVVPPTPAPRRPDDSGAIPLE
jgi:hypothetical protein